MVCDVDVQGDFARDLAADAAASSRTKDLVDSLRRRGYVFDYDGSDNELAAADKKGEWSDCRVMTREGGSVMGKLISSTGVGKQKLPQVMACTREANRKKKPPPPIRLGWHGRDGGVRVYIERGTMGSSEIREQTCGVLGDEDEVRCSSDSNCMPLDALKGRCDFNPNGRDSRRGPTVFSAISVSAHALADGQGMEADLTPVDACFKEKMPNSTSSFAACVAERERFAMDKTQCVAGAPRCRDPDGEVYVHPPSTAPGR